MSDGIGRVDVAGTGGATGTGDMASTTGAAVGTGIAEVAARMKLQSPELAATSVERRNAALAGIREALVARLVDASRVLDPLVVRLRGRPKS